MKRFPFGSILLTITALQSWSVEKRWKSGSTLERRFNPIQLRPGLFRIAALRYRSGWKRETLVVAGSTRKGTGKERGKNIVIAKARLRSARTKTRDVAIFRSASWRFPPSHPCIDFLSSRCAGIKRRKAFDSARLRLHRGRGYYYRLLGPITLRLSLVAVVVARRASRRFPFEDFSLGEWRMGWKAEGEEGTRENGSSRIDERLSGTGLARSKLVSIAMKPAGIRRGLFNFAIFRLGIKVYEFFSST